MCIKNQKKYHMKKIATILTVCLFAVITQAQTASVEESTVGIQTGFLGVWVHNEYGLSNQIALRSEIGLDAGFFGGRFYNRSGFIMAPVITLEPRWYYNLDRRVKKNRHIDGNSGNFISLKTSYRPDWFVISNVEGLRLVSDVSFIPTWGIRRNLGNHFTYETGIGLGYVYYFAKEAGFSKNEGEIALNLHLRIGYRF